MGILSTAVCGDLSLSPLRRWRCKSSVGAKRRASCILCLWRASSIDTWLCHPTKAGVGDPARAPVETLVHATARASDRSIKYSAKGVVTIAPARNGRGWSVYFLVARIPTNILDEIPEVRLLFVMDSHRGSPSQLELRYIVWQHRLYEGRFHHHHGGPTAGLETRGPGRSSHTYTLGKPQVFFM